MRIVNVEREPRKINKLPTSKRKSPGRPRKHPHGTRKQTYYADYQEEAQIAQRIEAGSSRTDAVQALVRAGVALETASEETFDAESGMLCKLVPLHLVEVDDQGDQLVEVDDQGDQLVEVDDQGDQLVEVDDQGDQLVEESPAGDRAPTWEEVNAQYQEARENYQKARGKKARRTQGTEGPIRSCIAILARLRHLAEQSRHAEELEARKQARAEKRREKAGKLPPWQAPQGPQEAREAQQAQPWGRNPGDHDASPWGPWRPFGPRISGGSILHKLSAEELRALTSRKDE